MASTILLICDRELILAGISCLLRRGQNQYVVVTAANSEEGFLKANLITPSLVILYLPNQLSQYLDTCRQLGKICPNANILVISNELGLETMISFLACGVRGFIADDTAASQLLDDICSVASGKVVIRYVGGRKLANESIFVGRSASFGEAIAKLSESEQRVLSHLALGSSNKQIAHTLYLSEATVKWHLSNIYNKLAVKGRSEAILCCVRAGLDRSA